MNRRHLWALIAASALLAGCGGGGTTTPTTGPTVSSQEPSSLTAAGTTPVETSPAATPIAGSATPPVPDASATSPAGSAAETTSTVIPAELDGQSAAWFEAVCEQMDVLPTEEGSLPPQAVFDFVKVVSAAMIATSQTATTLPPPTIDGGAELAQALSDSMSGAGTDLAAQAASYLTEYEGANPYSMKSVLESYKVMLQVAFLPLNAMDPAVKGALHQFPACQTYGY